MHAKWLVQSLALIACKSYLMKQFIIFINRLVTSAIVAIEHRFMSPGRDANEPMLAVVRVKSQSRIYK